LTAKKRDTGSSTHVPRNIQRGWARIFVNQS